MASGCTQLNPQYPKTVKLNLTIDKWESFLPPEKAHKIESFVIVVKEGEKFGPTGFIASTKNKPFKLLEIIDENSIKIQFDESLVVAGEPISQQSKQNPKIVSNDETCFRTRSYDSGTDLCLRILNLREDCTKEGHSYGTGPFPPDSQIKTKECCEGLTAIRIADNLSGFCQEQTDGLMCAKCGNGKCSLGENICNCPKDCQ